jgi:hypothetical protein
VLVLRKGSDSELVSVFTRTQFQDLKFKPGIATGRDGQPLASMEVVTIMILDGSRQSQRRQSHGARPAMPAGIEMRRNVHLVARALVPAGAARSGGGQVGGRPFSRGADRQEGRISGAAIGKSWACSMPAGGAQEQRSMGRPVPGKFRLTARGRSKFRPGDRDRPVTAKALVNSLNDDQRWK